MRFDDRQRDALGLEVAVRRSAGAQEVGSSDLEPDEVVRAIHDAHLVRLGVPHPHP